MPTTLKIVAAVSLLAQAGAAAALLLPALAQSLAERGFGRRSAQPLEVLAGIRDEIEVELGDTLLDDAPHGLAEVRHEAHDREGGNVAFATAPK